MISEKKADGEKAKKVISKIQQSVEKTTLGDIGALAQLKEKMDSNAEKKSSKKPKAEAPETIVEEVKTEETTTTEE